MSRFVKPQLVHSIMQARHCGSQKRDKRGEIGNPNRLAQDGKNMVLVDLGSDERVTNDNIPCIRKLIFEGTNYILPQRADNK